jgi:hypothetical protein
MSSQNRRIKHKISEIKDRINKNIFNAKKNRKLLVTPTSLVLSVTPINKPTRSGSSMNTIVLSDNNTSISSNKVAEMDVLENKEMFVNINAPPKQNYNNFDTDIKDDNFSKSIDVSDYSRSELNVPVKSKASFNSIRTNR